MSIKLLRSPSSTADQSKNSRPIFNIFYIATGDTKKERGSENEFIIDTAASSSIIIFRNFCEICQTQHPITVKRSSTQTKTYSGQVVPKIGFATIIFSYDPDGHSSFLLTLWISESKISNLLGMDLC